VSSRWLAASQGDQPLFDLFCDDHFVWPLAGPMRMEGRFKTFFHKLLPYPVDGRKTHPQRCGYGVVGIPHAFQTGICLQQNAAMEQFASGSFARRYHFPQHTAFLIREGDTKFGHGGAPSPETTNPWREGEPTWLNLSIEDCQATSSLTALQHVWHSQSEPPLSV